MHGLILAAAIAIHPGLGQPGDCSNAQTNMEMTACAWDEYKAADKELNAVWQKIIADIKSRDEEYLPAQEKQAWLKGMTDAEKAWATFKDADCNVGVAHEWWGGSGSSLAVGACLRDHTVQRLNELKERYDLAD